VVCESFENSPGSRRKYVTMDTRQTGDIGEKIAARYLEKKGFQIIDRNYVQRYAGSPQSAEIDIIAKKGDAISFVEVKTLFQKQNGQDAHWSPEEKVNFQKQGKIARAAESWLMEHKIDLDAQVQMDVISIVMSADSEKAKIRYFPNIG